MLQKFEDLLNCPTKMIDWILEEYTKNPNLFNQEDSFILDAFLALAED